jgi:hypothetical protein
MRRRLQRRSLDATHGTELNFQTTLVSQISRPRPKEDGNRCGSRAFGTLAHRLTADSAGAEQKNVRRSYDETAGERVAHRAGLVGRKGTPCAT